jgi:DNA-directed RNA polymerase specialized sigma54-like protein
MQRQTQTQRQTLKYSPLQIQMLNLLHLTTMELEQRIKEELEENPVLEEGKEDTASEDTTDGMSSGTMIFLTIKHTPTTNPLITNSIPVRWLNPLVSGMILNSRSIF